MIIWKICHSIILFVLVHKTSILYQFYTRPFHIFPYRIHIINFVASMCNKVHFEIAMLIKIEYLKIIIHLTWKFVDLQFFWLQKWNQNAKIITHTKFQVSTAKNEALPYLVMSRSCDLVFEFWRENGHFENSF